MPVLMHPHLDVDIKPNVKNQKCNKPVIPSQRGASNVYFAVTRSAISIPPWINPLYNLIDEHLRDIDIATGHYDRLD